MDGRDGPAPDHVSWRCGVVAVSVHHGGNEHDLPPEGPGRALIQEESPPLSWLLVSCL